MSDEIFGTFTVGALLAWQNKQAAAPKLEAPCQRKRVKKWLGTVPSKCDVCGADVKQGFIDGRTKHGPWGILCGKCHKEVGVGLGTGYGQKYELQDGEYIKVAG